MRLAVQFDDGRSIAFDVKDYAHQGNATTIHKAQEMAIYWRPRD